MMPDLGKTILLVTNDAEYALHAAERIKAGGFDVVTANNGETAVGIIRNGRRIDLVIIDLDGGIDGIQAAAMILASHDLPLLFLDGHLEPATIDRTEKLSHYGLIQKGTGDAVLLSSIKMAFRLHNTHLESKIREQSLRESQEMFSKSFRLTPLSMAISLASDRRYIEVNEAFISLTGYSREEVIGHNSLELGLWVDAETRTQIGEKIAVSGEAHDVPVRLRTKSGEIRDAVYSAAKILLGGVPHVVSQVLDITERKQAEEALRESKERLELALIGSNLGFYDLDLQTGRGYTDEQYLGMLGYAPGEIDLGWKANWERQVHPDDLGFANHPFQSDLREETDIYYEEYRMRHKSGKWVWVRDRSQITARGTDGRPLRMTGIHENITERKRAEESLRESKERLEFALIGGGLGTYEHNLQTGEIQVDARYLAMLDYAPGELDLANIDLWEQLVHPEDLAQTRSPHTEVEYRMRHKDGHWIWVLDTGRVVEHDSLGRPLRMNGVHQDISERKRTEEALRESETRYRELFDNISSGVAIYRAKDNGNDFVFQDFNQAGEKLDGDRGEDIIGKSVLEARPSLKEFGLFDVLKRVWETGVPEHFPVTYYQDNRLSGWYENYVYKLPSGEIVSIYDDITDRKQAEEALRESDALYQSLVDILPQSICRKDLAGRFTFANRHFLEALDKPLAEILDQTDFYIHPPELAESYRRDDQHVMETGQILETVEIHQNLVGAPTYVQAVKIPIRDVHGQITGVQIIFWDVTERKQAEQTQTDMIRAVAHDLSNPIAAIQATMELVPPLMKQNPTMGRYIEVIERNAMRLGQLTQNLLDAARIDVGELQLNKELVDLVVFLAEICKAEESILAGKEQCFDLQLPTGPMPFQGDRGRLEEVVVNLLGNAYKFAPRGTTITIRLAAEEHQAVLTVSNCGPGISSEHLPHIFDRFFRAGQQGQGSGLGLFIAKWMVEAHGGTISVQSEAGKGTTFTVQLPLP
jgi:PAS domain S-box-containing protein